MSTTTPGFNPDLDRPSPAWDGFIAGPWQDVIDVRDFIQRNYTPYEGDSSFLVGPTERTNAVWAKLTAMFPAEREKGIYDVDWTTPASITIPDSGAVTARVSVPHTTCATSRRIRLMPKVSNNVTMARSARGSSGRMPSSSSPQPTMPTSTGTMTSALQ